MLKLHTSFEKGLSKHVKKKMFFSYFWFLKNQKKEKNLRLPYLLYLFSVKGGTWIFRSGYGIFFGNTRSGSVFHFYVCNSANIVFSVQSRTYTGRLPPQHLLPSLQLSVCIGIILIRKNRQTRILWVLKYQQRDVFVIWTTYWFLYTMSTVQWALFLCLHLPGSCRLHRR